MEPVDSRERISHVVRRLSLGVHPELVESATDVDNAASRLLDLSPPAAVPPRHPGFGAHDTRRGRYVPGPGTEFRLRQMVTSRRPLEERLIWFWSDHFATSNAKVRSMDLMWNQHLAIRKHATGSFAELLHAMSRDGAMLVYLDGLLNRLGRVNENYAREAMELHTLGRGHYTQSDVVNAARACTGWVVSTASRPGTVRPGSAEGDVSFLPARHDSDRKTILGVTGDLDLGGFIDVLLEQPRTASFVAGKLYRELVGLEPGPAILAGLARAFQRDWSIMSLVETIVGGPRFRSDEAVWAKVRSPLEKVVGFMQAAGGAARMQVAVVNLVLTRCGFDPWTAPNPAGFAKGPALLGPAQLVHMVELLAMLDADRLPDLPARGVLAQFGLHSVSRNTLDVVEGATSPLERFALSFLSPEYSLA